MEKNTLYFHGNGAEDQPVSGTQAGSQNPKNKQGSGNITLEDSLKPYKTTWQHTAQGLQLL